MKVRQAHDNQFKNYKPLRGYCLNKGVMCFYRPASKREQAMTIDQSICRTQHFRAIFEDRMGMLIKQIWFLGFKSYV